MYKTIVLVLLVSMSSYAQQEMNFPLVKPEMVGLSSERLNQLRPLLQGYVDEHKLPGMISMVARHGKLVNFEGYGWMGTDQPMQLNAIFRIASMTKPITSVAVMMLYEEGRFKLDDPVAFYIPEFKNLKVFSHRDKEGIHLEDQKKPMTISDLLTHTSGLGSGVEDTYVDSIYREVHLSSGTLKDMIQKLARIPLLYQPGTKWKYGRSSDVLAYLVEVVSGKSLDQFFRERIFTPLKMKDTGYSVPKEKLNRVSSVYTIGNKMITDPEVNDVSRAVTFFSGNGGLVSTATDYMIFSQMLLNKGEYMGVRLLQRPTVELMTSIQIPSQRMPTDDFFGPMLKGMGFGYGMAVVQDQAASGAIGSKGSYWWAGAANTYFFIDPREEIILILMTQFVPSYYYPINQQFRELVYKSIVDG